MARVALLEGESVVPGAEALAQIVCDAPLGVLAGDAFVLRDASASRTLGGGRVIDPFAPARRRRSPERLEMLRRLEEPDAERRVRSLLERASMGVDLATLRLAWNTAEIRLDASTHRLGDTAFGAEAWQRLSERLLAALAEHHARRPDELGLDLARIRHLFPRLDAGAVEAVADSLVASGRLGRTGPWWHLPGHSAEFSAREQKLLEKLLRLLEAGELDPPWVRDLAERLRVPEQDVRSLLIRVARRGGVYQVVKDLFYAPRAIGRLARIAKQLEEDTGVVRAADFRDRIGLGRKRAIQILEFFDRIGFTRRARDDHRIRSDSLLKLEERAS
jgi:selenocysteine-specific elongation factor